MLLIFLQEDGSDCSIFSFDVSANRSRLVLAKNAVRKLKTLRHPGIVRVLDTVEVRDAKEKPGRDGILSSADRHLYLRCD